MRRRQRAVLPAGLYRTPSERKDIQQASTARPARGRTLLRHSRPGRRRGQGTGPGAKARAICGLACAAGRGGEGAHRHDQAPGAPARASHILNKKEEGGGRKRRRRTHIGLGDSRDKKLFYYLFTYYFLFFIYFYYFLFYSCVFYFCYL